MQLSSFFCLSVFLCIGYCMPQRCPAEIQPPFNEDILTVYESCNRPLSKAKTHFPTQFQTFNNLPHHCTTRESMQLGQQIWSFVRIFLIHLSFHETLPDVKGGKLHKNFTIYLQCGRLEGVAMFSVLIESLGKRTRVRE